MYQIYCDLDGVLTDFEKAYNHLGLGNYNRHVLPLNFYKNLKIAGEAFWKTMPWKKDGRLLWKFLKNKQPIILSAPTLEKSSRVGKTNWVINNLGKYQKIILENKKYLYADKTSILIDDKLKNIYNWRENGGIGIIHTSAQSTIKQLKDLNVI